MRIMKNQAKPGFKKVKSRPITPKADRTINAKRYSRSRKVFIFKFINLFFFLGRGTDQNLV